MSKPARQSDKFRTDDDGVQRKPLRRAKPKKFAAAHRKMTSSPEAPPVEVVERPLELMKDRVVDAITSAQSKKAEFAQDLLQDVFVEALETCQDASAAFDLDPDDLETVPASWKAELSDERAVKRRHRVAKAALMNNREAPVALQMATNVVQNVVRLQAKQNAVMTVKRLNVAVIIGGVKQEYPELEMKTGPDREDD